MKSVDRVAAAAQASGHTLTIRRTDGTARTAEDAAKACGCAVNQIVKSLIFAGSESGQLVLFLVRGDAKLNATKAATLAGERLGRADAKVVRERTGFAIGGVSPIGHLTPLPTFIDEKLSTASPLWAAAGAPDAVFETTRDLLVALTDGTLADLAD